MFVQAERTMMRPCSLIARKASSKDSPPTYVTRINLPPVSLSSLTPHEMGHIDEMNHYSRCPSILNNRLYQQGASRDN